MPANRSRTVGWRRCLRQIHERNGAIEIALARHYDDSEPGRHLVWRVRLLEVSDDEIVVEQPMALGQTIPVESGVDIVAIIAIGQNRWIFHTQNLEPLDYRLADGKTVVALRLALPENVQRCQRRSYYRIEAAALNLPEVELWPLMDPKSVLVAERANELQFERSLFETAADAPLKPQPEEAEDMMPEVGPRFTATLLNIGGGGVGIRVGPADNQVLNRHQLFWLRVSLPPELATPICASAKLVHTHLESTQHLYAGLAFDFSFNPGHQRFVADQIYRFVAIQQRAMLQRQVDEQDRRRSA